MSELTPSANDQSHWFPKPYADFVAKLRVPFGFVLLVAFAWLSRPTPSSIWHGFEIAIFGLLLRGWATGHLAKNKELATGGPYAFIRNPLYVGTVIVAAGMVVAGRSLVLAAIFALVLLFVYLPVIELEEQHLRQIFPEYAAYAAKVNRLIPVSRWRGVPRRRFSWALYSKNEEYKALVGFLLAFVWLAGKYQWLQP